MTVEAEIFQLLRSVLPPVVPPAMNVFPDVAPLSAVPPYAVYQQVGGESLTYLGREVPTKKHGRFQVTVWCATRAQAAALGVAIENAFILAAPMQATPLGSPVADHEEGTGYRGSRQDFGIWSDR